MLIEVIVISTEIVLNEIYIRLSSGIIESMGSFFIRIFMSAVKAACYFYFFFAFDSSVLLCKVVFYSNQITNQTNQLINKRAYLYVFYKVTRYFEKFFGRYRS